MWFKMLFKACRVYSEKIEISLKTENIIKIAKFLC